MPEFEPAPDDAALVLAELDFAEPAPDDAAFEPEAPTTPDEPDLEPVDEPDLEPEALAEPDTPDFAEAPADDFAAAEPAFETGPPPLP